MIEVRVRVPSPLREFSEGRSEVSVEIPGDGAVTLAEVFQAMRPRWVGVRDRTLDEHGNLRPHMNVFVAGVSVRGMNGMDTKVSPDDDVVIFPAVSGG